MKKNSRNDAVLAVNDGGDNGRMMVGLGTPLGISVDQGDHNTPGVIVAANETRFTEANFSQPLTSYATGYRDPNNLMELLDFVAPRVPVPRRFEFAQTPNAEYFLSETDDVRAIGANFKRVEYTSTKTNSKTLNKGLTMRIDRDAVEGMENWDTIYTGKLIQRLTRNEVIRAITALTAAGNNTAVTWDTTAGKDPDQDVLARLIAGTDSLGFQVNRALYGQVAWNKRKVAHRAQTSAGGFASASLLSEEEVAGYLGVDRIYVSRARYVTRTTTKSKVVGDVVLLFYAEDGMTTEDPATMKRFVTAIPGIGGNFKVYMQEVGSKFVDITVEHYSQIVVTSTAGCEKLTVN